MYVAGKMEPSALSRGSGARRAFGAAVLAAAVALAPAPARGAPTDEERAAARGIFKEGLELEGKKQWKEALERFTKVAAVIVTPGVRYHLGLCEENLGHWVAALNQYELATQEAKRVLADASSPDDIKRDAEAALQRAGGAAATLRERVPHVKIETTGKLSVSRVLLDGAAVSAVLLDALPVDPGKHVFVVERRGKELDRKELDIAEGETKKLRLAVDDTGHEAEPPPPPPEGPTQRAPKPWELSTARIPAVVSVSLGLGALAGTAILWGLREDSILKLLAQCPSLENCPPELQGLQKDGILYTDAARGLLVGGGAAVVLGTVLWFAVPGTVTQAPAQKATTRLVPLVAPLRGGGFVGLGGTF